MATRAAITLQFHISDGLNAFFTINLYGVSKTFTRVESQPLIGEGQYDSAQALAQAIQAADGNNYQTTISGDLVTVTARNYGTIYDFGTVSENGTFYDLVTAQTAGTGTPFTVTHTKTNVDIKGTSTGSIDITAAGGNTPYSYAWADGPTTEDRSSLPAGTYQCNVTEAGGMVVGSGNIVITEPDYTPITITLGYITHATCYGSATGVIDIAASGGTGVYTFQWADGPTTDDRTNIPAGQYTVTVTDSAGNTGTATYTVGQNTEIVVVATVNEDDVTLAVSGGVGPYTYLWDDGTTTRDRTDIEPGQYICTITDSVGCMKVVTVNVANFNFAFSKNPVILRLRAQQPQTKPNLSFLCEVWIEKVYLSGNFEKVNVQEQPADSDGSTAFNVQSILDAYLESSLPEGKETIVYRADSVFKRFYLRYTEKFGNPPVPSAYTQVDINYVLLGGLSFEEHAARTFFKSYFPTKKPFFTWEPETKEVYPDQPEYLYYVHNSFTLTTFHCYVRIFYTDGTFITENFHNQANVRRFEVYCIPANVQALNLNSYQPTKTIASYWIFLKDQFTSDLSEVRFYNIKTDYAAQKRYFLYLNSIGGFNTLCCTGTAVKELDPESQQIEKILPYNYKISEGETTTVKKMAKPSLKINTGHLTKEYFEALQDFVISENVILYDNGRYIPGSVDNKNVKPIDENETICELEFEFNLPKMYRYTPRL